MLMHRITKFVFLILIVTFLFIDGYNLFFRFTYNFNKRDFGNPITIFADPKLPLRSTIRISGNFECPVYLRHGFDLNKVKHKAEIVGQIDTVIYTEFYRGNYMFEFENQNCVTKLNRLQFRVSNLDFTILTLF